MVVEKDTVFQHLLHSGLLQLYPLILVTGRGYPDLLTRRLLQKLQRIAPNLPQLYLGDFDACFNAVVEGNILPKTQGFSHEKWGFLKMFPYTNPMKLEVKTPYGRIPSGKLTVCDLEHGHRNS